MENLPIILAIAPFVVFIFLLLVKKTPLFKTSIITLLIYTALIVFYWKIVPSYLYISYAKGFFIALDIFIIIFGAVFFLEILRDLKIIKNISYYLSTFSRDYRVQVILIAWFFENFLEGTAGFGTAAAIAVPLLMALGLPVIKSLVIGLLGNSTSGAFGAAGTPIRVGLAGLNITSVPLTTALINTVGFIVPVFMLWIITRGRKNKKKEFLEMLPFAIWAGIAFVIPSVLTVFLGQEFPSILGAIIGFILIAITTKLGIFIPKKPLTLVDPEKKKNTISIFKTFLPYLLFIALLILGKIFIGKTGIILNIGYKEVFPLFNPGFLFIITGLIIIPIWKASRKTIKKSSKIALKSSILPFLVIISMSAIVQLMINSEFNTSGLPSAMILIAKGLESTLLPFFAPFIGAFGSFVTGSVTVSNIMFGNFFNTAAMSFGFNQTIILSLGVVGAAAGNMIALADILAAEAVTGVKNSERQILKGVFIPCLTYLILTGIVGIIVIKLF
ncbi:MAG: L-lactate permease [Patescibacteria group bacterium]|nr:L-lactate permease [Patescibacteria group bacterium]